MFMPSNKLWAHSFDTASHTINDYDDEIEQSKQFQRYHDHLQRLKTLKSSVDVRRLLLHRLDDGLCCQACCNTDKISTDDVRRVRFAEHIKTDVKTTQILSHILPLDLPENNRLRDNSLSDNKSDIQRLFCDDRAHPDNVTTLQIKPFDTTNKSEFDNENYRKQYSVCSVLSNRSLLSEPTDINDTDLANNNLSRKSKVCYSNDENLYNGDITSDSSDTFTLTPQCSVDSALSTSVESDHSLSAELPADCADAVNLTHDTGTYAPFDKREATPESPCTPLNYVPAKSILKRQSHVISAEPVCIASDARANEYHEEDVMGYCYITNPQPIRIPALNSCNTSEIAPKMSFLKQNQQCYKINRYNSQKVCPNAYDFKETGFSFGSPEFILNSLW